MKTAPVRPARIEWGTDGTPHAPDFGDVYHPRVGALAQARHVFIAGNGLPGRWAGREHFTVLETGFGLGHNFIATWDAWQRDAARSRWLHYVAVEGHPPARGDLARAHASSPLPELAQALVAAWPELTPNLHPLAFEGGRVRLLLAFGDIASLLRELRCSADAFYLDGFAPACNPAMWTPQVMKALARRAAPGATAATWSVARELGEGLKAAGFEVARAPGIGGKREITLARWQPRFVPRSAPMPAPRPAADALVVGAGLAGAFAAQALRRLGWQVRVLDQHAHAAQEASGNPAGVFHGTVHPQDGPHARLLRAAALQAQRHLHPLLAAGAVPGQGAGLLRVQGGGLGAIQGVIEEQSVRGGELGAMQALLTAQGLPPGCVQALDCSEATRRAGVPLPGPAWYFPGGGWLAPQALVARVLQGLPFVGGTRVAALRPVGGRWQLLGEAGGLLAEAAVVVLANAGQAARLLAPWAAAGWPLRRVRGQLTVLPGFTSSLALPLAGDGYVLPLPATLGGGLVCGATSSVDDDEAAERRADHEFNLERLARLCGLAFATGATGAAGEALHGRVAWRVQADDSLPVIGPVPVATPAPGARADQARLLPRCEGLFVCTAFGGRGITLAPLAGELLAAQIAGTPLALEQSLLDAIDPGRWQVRAARRV